MSEQMNWAQRWSVNDDGEMVMCDTGSWVENAYYEYLKSENTRLKAENARLRASSFVTAVPVEQYERVIKAGDAVALDYAERIEIEAGETVKTLMKTVPVLREWNAAKRGKQP